MKRVGVREFRDHATKYLAGDEVLTIERHGQPIGTYIPKAAERPRRLELAPLPNEQERRRARSEALAELRYQLDQMMAETGYTEDELARLLNPYVPESEWPDPPKRAASEAETEAEPVGAAGR